MTKVVWKFATGQEVPKEARYLCTREETRTERNATGESRYNVLVWHYYELDADVADKCRKAEEE